MRRTIIVFALFGILFSGSIPAYADTLSGLRVFATDSSGAYLSLLQGYSSAVPNVGFYVPWVTDGNMASGSFINQGSTRDQAGISYLLTPGTHTFYFFAETGLSEGQSIWPGDVPPFWGLNLFFNGNAGQPGLSVFVPTSNSAGGSSVFAPIVGLTPPLPSDPAVFASGTLGFIHGATNVTLTDFAFFDPRVYNSDRISNFDAVPDGNREYVGRFTLQVTETPVPETNSFLLLTSGLIGLWFVRRRRTEVSDQQRSSKPFQYL